MTIKDQVRDGIEHCIGLKISYNCSNCPYDRDENGESRNINVCKQMLLDDFDLLISDMENTIKLLEDES